ncbi:MAG: succinyl-diaminopimelate desuccinylase [Burkholderiales bacterium]|nr:succinyl-diaminopimelate desuccinylase [Burkholderiales bacterium]
MDLLPVLELTKELVSRKSITPNDSGCQHIIQSRLDLIGFKWQYLNRNATSNLWITHGNSSPVLVFGGHTDVVPPGEGWKTDPFTPTQVDGTLVGRGTQDMKTSVAAFTEAAIRFVKDNPNHPGTIALLLTSDEEGDGLDGMKMVVEILQNRGLKADFSIVGEPTCVTQFGDTIKNGRRGSLNAKIIIEGTQGHVAYPDKVKNPIHVASEVLAKLKDIQWDEGHPGFPPTSFQVSNINAGTGAVNVVPGSCEILLNLRYSPAISAEEIEKRIEAVLKEVCERDGCTFKIEWKRSALPFSTKGTNLISAVTEAIEEVTGITPRYSTSGGTSDARFISQWCPEVIEFGPVNNLIHKANEAIPLADMEKLEQVYYLTIKKLLTPNP